MMGGGLEPLVFKLVVWCMVLGLGSGTLVTSLCQDADLEGFAFVQNVTKEFGFQDCADFASRDGCMLFRKDIVRYCMKSCEMCDEFSEVCVCGERRFYEPSQEEEDALVDTDAIVDMVITGVTLILSSINVGFLWKKKKKDQQQEETKKKKNEEYKTKIKEALYSQVEAMISETFQL